MEKVIKNCGILKKKVFYESKGSDVARTFNEYSEAAKKEGAFLFIVMKGRFSEGINFSDYLCRCLVVVGIPFLPRKESNVEEKLDYLRQNYSSEDA
jgi:Rad3-related DNA helicase